LLQLSTCTANYDFVASNIYLFPNPTPKKSFLILLFHNSIVMIIWDLNRQVVISNAFGPKNKFRITIENFQILP